VDTNARSPVADGAFNRIDSRTVCFKTEDSARKHLSQTDISLSNNGYYYHFEMYYHFGPGGASLIDGNSTYKNFTEGEILSAPNDSSWSTIIHQQIH
jgi:hypothetical protein